MALSAFGVEDDRISKGWVSSAAGAAGRGAKAARRGAAGTKDAFVAARGAARNTARSASGAAVATAQKAGNQARLVPIAVRAHGETASRAWKGLTPTQRNATLYGGAGAVGGGAGGAGTAAYLKNRNKRVEKGVGTAVRSAAKSVRANPGATAHYYGQAARGAALEAKDAATAVGPHIKSAIKNPAATAGWYGQAARGAGLEAVGRYKTLSPITRGSIVGGGGALVGGGGVYAGTRGKKR